MWWEIFCNTFMIFFAFSKFQAIFSKCGWKGGLGSRHLAKNTENRRTGMILKRLLYGTSKGLHVLI